MVARMTRGQARAATFFSVLVKEPEYFVQICFSMTKQKFYLLKNLSNIFKIFP